MIITERGAPRKWTPRSYFAASTAAVAILLVALLIVGDRWKMDTMADMTIKMPFPERKGMCDYDPAGIHFSQEYNFLVNIYSPLVEYSAAGHLVSGVAEKFEWFGTEAHFTIRDSLRTIDGRQITAEDAEASFKRLFVLASNTHGDLKDMVCRGAKLKSMQDPCPGMFVSADKRKLIFRFEEKKIFLFQMLASIDFSVIPRDSFDGKSLKIIDYRNTSGPYYVKNDRGDGNIELAANPSHFHFSKDIPQTVVCVPVNPKTPESTLTLFDEGKINHIGTFRFSAEKLLNYAAGRKDVAVHATYPNRLFWFSFTKKGRSKFSVQQRLALGKAVRREMVGTLPSHPGFEAVEQLFPALGDATLTESHLVQLREAFKAAPEDISINRPLVVWAWSMSKENQEILKKFLPSAKIVTDVLKLPGAVDYKKEGLEEPEIWFLSGDTSHKEDITFFSYYMNYEFLHVYGEEGKNWLRKYMSTEDRAARLAMAEKLQFETLINGEVIPLLANSYVSIVKKPWSFKYSKFSATNFVWRLTKD